MTSLADEPIGPEHLKIHSFDTDPGWRSFRSRLVPQERPTVRQDFGYHATRHAGGVEPGEIGGRIHRAHRRAYYAKSINVKTLDDHFVASGKFAVTDDEGSSGVLIGWFNDASSQGWRTPNSIAMRLDGNGGKYWVFYEYGTSRWGTHGGGAFDGPRYQTTTTLPLKADGSVHRWKISYDPDGAGGNGLIEFWLDGNRWELPLLEGHRQQAASFDRFGIWNQQTSGRSMTVFFDELSIDGETQSFDEDPEWIQSNCRAEYPQQFMRPYHDFGFSLTSHTGGKVGEIGGTVYRDEAPAFYASPIAERTLDDQLYASGTIVLRSAGADSGVMLGWFNATDKQSITTLEQPSDFLAIMIEGPSRVGHYFRPAYTTSNGHHQSPTYEATDRERPLIRPDGTPHRWSLTYRPATNGRRSLITLTLDGARHYLEVDEMHRRENAKFDHFGIFNIQQGGHHVELLIDDVRFTD